MGLKLKELKEGTMYFCPLSECRVLVYSVSEKSNVILGQTYEWTEVKAVYFNKQKGQYDTFDVYENQLCQSANKEN